MFDGRFFKGRWVRDCLMGIGRLMGILMERRLFIGENEEDGRGKLIGRG